MYHVPVELAKAAGIQLLFHILVYLGVIHVMIYANSRVIWVIVTPSGGTITGKQKTVGQLYNPASNLCLSVLEDWMPFPQRC